MTTIRRLTLAAALATLATVPVLSAQTDLTPDANNPLITKGAPGTWDSWFLDLPGAVQDGANTLVFYSGAEQTSLGARIGLASSPDGVTFTRSKANPLLKPSASGWDSVTVHGPQVIQDSSGDWIMLYAGDDQPFQGPTPNIGRAVSTNGPAGPYVKDANPVFTVGAPGDWDEGFILPGAFLEVSPGNYMMFYTGGITSQPTNNLPVQIGVAFSTDTVNWTRYDDPRTTTGRYANSDPVLRVGAPASWNGAMVAMPAVCTDGVRWHMYFVGALDQNSFGNVGYATSLDGLHWEESPANPVLQKTSQSWSSGRIFGPSVLATNSGYSLYYQGISKQIPGGAIGLATSPVTEDLFLDATPEDPAAGQTLTFQSFEGNPGDLTLLFVVDINGTPFQWYLPPAAAFDANGIATRQAVIPSGLAGITATFQSMALGRLTGSVVVSNRETVSFQ